MEDDRFANESPRELEFTDDNDDVEEGRVSLLTDILPNYRNDMSMDTLTIWLQEDYEKYSKDEDLMAIFRYGNEIYLARKKQEEAPSSSHPLDTFTEDEKSKMKQLFGRVFPGRIVDEVFEYIANKKSEDLENAQSVYQEMAEHFRGPVFSLILDVSIGCYAIAAHHYPEVNTPELMAYYQFMKLLGGSQGGSCTIC
jgi:hypothetical protein